MESKLVRRRVSSSMEHLPEHLLLPVLSRLELAKTWVHCQAVCKAWQAAVPRAVRTIRYEFARVPVTKVEAALNPLLAKCQALEELTILVHDLYKSASAPDKLRPLRDKCLAKWLPQVGATLKRCSIVERFSQQWEMWTQATSHRLCLLANHCRQLEHLELRSRVLLTGPQSISPLLHLKTLVLAEVGIPTEGLLEELLSAASELLDLHLVDITAPFRHLPITSTSVRHLSIEDGHCGFMRLDVKAPQLEKLSFQHPTGALEIADDVPPGVEDFFLSVHSSPLLKKLQLILADRVRLGGIEVRGKPALEAVNLSRVSNWEDQVFPLLRHSAESLVQLRVWECLTDQGGCDSVTLEELAEKWPALDSLSLDCNLVAPNMEHVFKGDNPFSTIVVQEWPSVKEVTLYQGRYARWMLANLIQEVLQCCRSLVRLKLELQCNYGWRLENHNRREQFIAEMQSLGQAHPTVDLIVYDPSDNMRLL